MKNMYFNFYSYFLLFYLFVLACSEPWPSSGRRGREGHQDALRPRNHHPRLQVSGRVLGHQDAL